MTLFTFKTKKANKSVKYNITRKKNINSLNDIIHKEFIRRISEPFSFTVLNPNTKEIEILDKKFGHNLTDDEKWDLYLNTK